MRYRRLVLGPVCALVAGGAAGYFVQTLSFAEQWPLFEALRTTAGIVFAIAGAWLAVIYPDTLSRLLKPLGDGRAGDVGRLIQPMIFSALTLIGVLVIAVAGKVVPTMPVAVANREVLLRILFGVLIALTWMQCWTLLMILAPGESLKHGLFQRQERQRYHAAATSQVTSIPKPDYSETRMASGGNAPNLG